MIKEESDYEEDKIENENEVEEGKIDLRSYLVTEGLFIFVDRGKFFFDICG